MPRSKQPRQNPLVVSAGFRSFVLDQLGELEDVVPRSMFGGVGLYCRGVFFGIIAGDRLYLKVDDSNRADYETAGEKPFRPYPNRAGTMQYYSVPLAILESAPELAAWARKAISMTAGSDLLSHTTFPMQYFSYSSRFALAAAARRRWPTGKLCGRKVAAAENTKGREQNSRAPFR